MTIIKLEWLTSLETGLEWVWEVGHHGHAESGQPIVGVAEEATELDDCIPHQDHREHDLGTLMPELSCKIQMTCLNPTM